MKKNVAIIQARCSSTRFPNKIFADICGKPLIWHVINRLKFAKTVDKIILATTINPLDDKLYAWAIENNILVYRGSENDVLNRFYETVREYDADVIIRVTADDPFKEPLIIDQAVRKLQEANADFVCNNYPPTYPEGLDVEVFTRSALEIAELQSKSAFEREHVTQYFYHHPSDFKMLNISYQKYLSYLRWTIDTEKDFLMVQKIYSLLFKGEDEIFHMEDILNLIDKYPEIAQMNADVIRSEMYKSK